MQVCLCACTSWNFGNTILKKIYIQWYFKLTTDNFAHILEQGYRLVFKNLRTENQNVNSVIVIVLASCVISYKKLLITILCFDNLFV